MSGESASTRIIIIQRRGSECFRTVVCNVFQDFRGGSRSLSIVEIWKGFLEEGVLSGTLKEGIVRAVNLKCKHATQSLGKLVKAQRGGAAPLKCHILEWDLGICIFSKFPVDANAGDPAFRTTVLDM